MIFLKLLPVILSFLLMAAHFSRVSQPWLMYLCLLLPFLLLYRKKWVKRVLQFLLIVGGLVWVERTIVLVNIRVTHNMPWVRLAIILGVAALFTMASSLLLETKRIRGRYREDPNAALPGAAAFILTSVLLSIIQLKVKIPVLLPERFLPGSGWILIFILAFLAGWLVNKFLTSAPGEHGKI